MMQLLSVILLALIASIQANTYYYTVTKISDGDTLTGKLSNGTTARIRLLCIDAPETKQLPWGSYSTARLAELTKAGSKVSVTNPKLDQYGRILGEVVNDKGVNVNIEMVREGLAVRYIYQSGCSRYQTHQDYAKKNKFNVWSDPTFIMPWEFRKNQTNIIQ